MGNYVLIVMRDDSTGVQVDVQRAIPSIVYFPKARKMKCGLGTRWYNRMCCLCLGVTLYFGIDAFKSRLVVHLILFTRIPW